MLKLPDATLRKMLTPERLAALGLVSSNTVTDDDLKQLLTPERKKALGLRDRHDKDDEHLDTPLIEFLCEPRYLDTIPRPYPAFKNMPQWFKDLELVMPENANRDHFGAIPATAKQCLPLLDAQSVGYVIPLYADANVRSNKDCSRVHVHSQPGESAGSTHHPDQLGGKEGVTDGGHAVKFHNPWVIKMRPGWSALFMAPINRFEEKRFTALAGMVDCDEGRYVKQVNFPSKWHLGDYDDVVKAGTPIVVVVPIRRADMERFARVRVMTEEERLEIGRIERVQNTRMGYYSKE